MAKKFYVVWAGRQTGIFRDWPSTLASVDKFKGARYKSFPTLAEAEQAFAQGAAPRARPANRAAPRQQAQSANAANSASKAEVQIYCDGGCDPNPGRAGSGLAIYIEGDLAQLWYGLFNPCGTNNTAELNALHQALLIATRAVKAEKTVEVLCDSMYAINCISTWAPSWKRNGWKRKGGAEIQNLELIKQCLSAYEPIKQQIQLNHIKAHAGTEGNELADRMTMVAVDREDREFLQYDGELDVAALLKLRAG